MEESLLCHQSPFSGDNLIPRTRPPMAFYLLSDVRVLYIFRWTRILVVSPILFWLDVPFFGYSSRL